MLKCSPVCKNQFCDNTTEDDYENLAMIPRMKMKVIQVKIVCETIDSIMLYTKQLDVSRISASDTLTTNWRLSR